MDKIQLVITEHYQSKDQQGRAKALKEKLLQYLESNRPEENTALQEIDHESFGR